MCSEKATCWRLSVRILPRISLRGKPTPVIFAILGDHQHDLPLKDVAVHQATAYAWYILVALHLLELAA